MSLYRPAAHYLNWAGIHYKQKFPGKASFTQKKLGSGTYWQATLVTHHMKLTALSQFFLCSHR
jgi:hypothetical protein